MYEVEQFKALRELNPKLEATYQDVIFICYVHSMGTQRSIIESIAEDLYAYLSLIDTQEDTVDNLLSYLDEVVILTFGKCIRLQYEEALSLYEIEKRASNDYWDRWARENPWHQVKVAEKAAIEFLKGL